ncbi:DNA replication and repair protein RecO [Lacinutrix venerupis]|uniref:DNA repair protein RecO n=1 Tax=Lacinutrix venerupis TaxID=1486034 RepID=A0AAC9LKN0_9FLAO|nr:DNA repair protein RecO [Lacinutrix venerupis]APX99126.1 DNA repair protein RecO [Lacinutrix venerupis]RLJ65495.1 DNA replication and repair protein RecO [Lacinutrix venerupis]
MLLTTNAIVLSKLKYRDNDLIIKCYTQKEGIVSYLLKGILKSKKGSKVAYYQLLTQLQIVTDFKPSRSLQYIKEVKINHLYSSLHTSVLKSAIVMFLAEVLSSSLQEEEQNDTLFNYLEATLQWLDTQDSYANFHLLFLLNLTKHLGFYPDTSKIELPYFNLEAGEFQDKKYSKYSISNENLTLLKKLLGTTFDALDLVKINAKQRQSFLGLILVYFELHLGTFKKPKSLQIFNEVFN